MIITLDSQTEAKLRETALREGQDVNTLVNSLLDEALERLSRQFAEDVAAIQEGLDAVKEGRERPFEEFLREHRARWNDKAPSQT